MRNSFQILFQFWNNSKSSKLWPRTPEIGADIQSTCCLVQSWYSPSKALFVLESPQFGMYHYVVNIWYCTVIGPGILFPKVCPTHHSPSWERAWARQEFPNSGLLTSRGTMTWRFRQHCRNTVAKAITHWYWTPWRGASGGSRFGVRKQVPLSGCSLSCLGDPQRDVTGMLAVDKEVPADLNLEEGLEVDYINKLTSDCPR